MPPFDLRLEKHSKNSGLLLVTFAVLLTGIYEADGFGAPRYFQRATRRVRLCGNVLADMVDFRCAGRGIFGGKRSSGDKRSGSKDSIRFPGVSATTPDGNKEEAPLEKDVPWLDKAHAFSFLTAENSDHDVHKRSIVRECCVVGCTLSTLERYCNKAGKRSDHHLFWSTKPSEQSKPPNTNSPQKAKVAELNEPSSKEVNSGEKKRDDKDSSVGLPMSSSDAGASSLSEGDLINPIKSSQSLHQRQPSFEGKTQPSEVLGKPRNDVKLGGLLKFLAQMTSTHLKIKNAAET